MSLLFWEELEDRQRNALLKYINKETMSDGKLYWNVLSRTVIPIVKEAHKLINDLAITVQLIQDNKQNIGIRSMK